ncbi:MAG: energy transducer TonB, partial [Pontixanthobacter sp.]
PSTSAPAASSSRSGGASREFSQAFDGAGASTTSSDSRAPASAISGAAKSSLLQSVVRQIRPHWKPPEGADADQLYTNVSFSLNENGSLSGTPRCATTQGVTDSNRTQAAIHCREAMRAVRAAAPFNLPDRFYNAWKTINDMKFGATL